MSLPIGSFKYPTAGYAYVDSTYVQTVYNGLLTNLQKFCDLLSASCQNYLEHPTHYYQGYDIHVVDDDHQEVGLSLTAYNALPENANNGIVNWGTTKAQVMNNIQTKLNQFKANTASNDNLMSADAAYDIITDCVHEVCRIWGQRFSYYDQIPSSELSITTERSKRPEVDRYFHWWQRVHVDFINEEQTVERHLIVRHLHGVGASPLVDINTFRRDNNKTIVRGDLTIADEVCGLIDRLFKYCDSKMTECVDHDVRNRAQPTEMTTRSGRILIYLRWRDIRDYPNSVYNTIEQSYRYNDFDVYGHKNDDDDNTWCGSNSYGRTVVAELVYIVENQDK